MSPEKIIPLVRPALVPWEQVEPLFAQIWKSGRLSCGEFTRRFEQATCEVTGARFAVAVSSCTSGLMLLLRALNITGEVVLPSFTWASTGHALVWNQITPVFADCLPDTFTLDPQDVRRRLTARTQAIFASNVFGVHPDMDALADVSEQAGVPLLCDSAQAIGARYNGRRAGSTAFAEVFSLSPTKVVTAVEGGLICTDDEKLADRLVSMRDYGKSSDGLDIESFGLSARLSELHAVVGAANLEHYRELINNRRRLAERYVDRLKNVEGVRFQAIPDGYESSYNYFVIQVDKRNELQEWLAEKGIESKRYFYPPLHRQSSYAKLALPEANLPVTEHAAATCLALPFYSDLPEKDVDLVAKAVSAFFARG